MSENELAGLVRQSRRAARFPPDARCTACGERNSVALVADSVPLCCYECRARSAGRADTEAHHVAGRANSPLTVRLPANDHRILSHLQQDWPVATLRNPDGNTASLSRSPLLRAAAMLRGFLDTLRLIIDRGLGWIPPALERLDAALVCSVGPTWWEHERFAGCFAECGA